MTNYFRSEPERSYSWNGWMPYGAGDLFAMDTRVDHDFGGNVTEQLISKGYTMTDDGRLLDLNGNEVASFVKEATR